MKNNCSLSCYKLDCNWLKNGEWLCRFTLLVPRSPLFPPNFPFLVLLFIQLSVVRLGINSLGLRFWRSAWGEPKAQISGRWLCIGIQNASLPFTFRPNSKAVFGSWQWQSTVKLVSDAQRQLPIWLGLYWLGLGEQCHVLTTIALYFQDLYFNTCSFPFFSQPVLGFWYRLNVLKVCSCFMLQVWQ